MTSAATTSPAWVGSDLAASGDWIRPESAVAIAECEAALGRHDGAGRAARRHRADAGLSAR